jgi:hypothetical protein
MFRNRLSSGAAILVLCSASGALSGAFPGELQAAETSPDVVYVTDELRLGLYQTEETSGRSIKTLVSGTRLNILERSLMSVQVRTDEGDQGWVKTAYLVEAEPARRRVAGLEQLQAETADALTAAQSAQSESAQQVASLEQELGQLREDVVNLPALQEQNAELKASLNASGIRVPIAWVIGVALAALVVGWLVGNWWLDRKVRRKFGGVRVY